MAEYKLEEKLVIAVASSALFDLSEPDLVFRTRGVEEYRAWQ
ncbi:MAG TPA: 5'-nucleotidase, partial [Myxococcota bacterium]|nr:5'-nucleotidase [Myxococcota bacterium]